MNKTLKKVGQWLLVAGMSLSLGTTLVNAQDFDTFAGSDLEEMQQDNKQKENFIVIDVRPEEEYHEGHLKHAVSIPLEELESNLSRLEDYNGQGGVLGMGSKSVVVYSDDQETSTEAAQILTDNDFESVQIGDNISDYDYTLVTYGSILLDELEENIGNEDVIIVDVRATEDFEEASVEGAINAPLDNKEILLDEITDKDAHIITFCYSGNQSAEVAQFLTENGYTNVQNSLDGSKESDDFPLEAN